jgi:DNA-binding transcriptional regulator YiaG
MNALRLLRLDMGLSQCEFATQLGIAEQTYRTWDSGRRRPPRAIVYKARRLQETAGGKLLSLQILAAEYHVHVRTLRKAAQDGRLIATFSARMAFGKRVAFASREAVEAFKRRYHRQTTHWNRPPTPAVCIVPTDYDRVVRTLRTSLQLTQSAFASRVGAANKAVIYQWESRRRRPSPVLWTRVEALCHADRRFTSVHTSR